MLTNKENIFSHKENIISILIWCFAISFILTFAVLLDNGIDIGYISMLTLSIIVLLTYFQFTLKDIFLYNDKFILSYSLNPLRSDKTFYLTDIESFRFHQGSIFDPCKVVIYFKTGKRKWYYFAYHDNDQELIDKLREMNFEVTTKGNNWK